MKKKKGAEMWDIIMNQLFFTTHSPATSFSFKNPRENIQILATLDSIQYFIFKIFFTQSRSTASSAEGIS